MIILSGCASAGGSSDPAASTPPAAAGIPAITVVKTGGIAGVHDTLHIESSGSWTLTDKSGATKNGRLTADDVAALKTLAADPRLLSEANATRAATKCRDAFNY